MNDIGPSPDWRSGISDTGVCDYCERTIPAEFLDSCSECEFVVCPDCRDEDKATGHIVCRLCQFEAVLT